MTCAQFSLSQCLVNTLPARGTGPHATCLRLRTLLRLAEDRLCAIEALKVRARRLLFVLPLASAFLLRPPLQQVATLVIHPLRPHTPPRELQPAAPALDQQRPAKEASPHLAMAVDHPQLAATLSVDLQATIIALRTRLHRHALALAPVANLRLEMSAIWNAP